MKKILLTSAIAFILCVNAYTEKETLYISPNNDGVQDILEVPIQIKEKRYVVDWNFIIENENGEIVRTISNKEKRDAKLTFKGFFKALITPKKGVTIPKSVAWNGVMDSGEIAPDGNYKYYMTAKDDNGNFAKTAKLSVIVDNTPPEINLTQPSDDGRTFGEGNKTLFPVIQNGSKEDLWTGVFTDSRGNVVRTVKWTSSEPLKFDWNGTNDAGLPLEDGIYSYKISATDRAGNKSAPASISNIIFSAEKPVTNITLSDGKYINPILEGMNEIKFNVEIPVPNTNSGNKLVAWSIQIVDEKDNVLYTKSGTDNPPETFSWVGYDNEKKIVADSNSLQAKVTAKYLNGFEAEPTKSPVFTLDTKAPKIKATTKEKTFSPDGDGSLDVLEIAQAIEEDKISSPINYCVGRFINQKGEIVKEIDFGSEIPKTFAWDGMNGKNEMAEDGVYKYELYAMDMAANYSTIEIAEIKLDTSKAEILLSLNRTAFNPLRPSDVRITPVVKSNSKITEFELSILNEEGKEVWNQNGTFLPISWTWNGNDLENKTCADGNYVALLTTKSANGSSASSKSQKFAIDTVPPTIELKTPFTVFSPDTDGQKDTLPITSKSSEEENWVARVYNAKNESVKTYTWKGKVDSFDFDGTDSNGNILPDGTYKLVFTSEDAAGNKGNSEIPNIVIDNRETKAYLTVKEDAFSPNGNGSFDTQTFTIKPTLKDGIESWKLDVITPEGKVVKTWSNENMTSIPEKLVWDGKGDDEKTIQDNIYTAKLKIVYKKGNIVETNSTAFISCVTPPQLLAKTAPNYFSPDNDGEDDDLFIQLKANTILPIKNWSFQINDPNNNKFWATSGKSSITEKIIWDGRSNSGELVQSATDYPYSFTVTDSLGMTSTVEGIIPIDILVVRDGNKLKMAVPSIIFRSDAADFKKASEVPSGKGLTDAQVKNNERVLKRIAVVLNKFKTYKVTIEGHASSMTGSQIEEEKDTAEFGFALKPLSKRRADFVKAKLKEYGVDASRLDTVGMGGSRPIVNIHDKPNVWKNRRVEFILNK